MQPQAVAAHAALTGGDTPQQHGATRRRATDPLAQHITQPAQCDHTQAPSWHTDEAGLRGDRGCFIANSHCRNSATSTPDAVPVIPPLLRPRLDACTRACPALGCCRGRDGTYTACCTSRERRRTTKQWSMSTALPRVPAVLHCTPARPGHAHAHHHGCNPGPTHSSVRGCHARQPTPWLLPPYTLTCIVYGNSHLGVCSCTYQHSSTPDTQ